MIPVLETLPSIARCDFCRGPATWTLFRGEVFYSCDLPCDGFLQRDLFEDLVGSPPMEGGDAAAAREDSVPKDNELNELPF